MAARGNQAIYRALRGAADHSLNGLLLRFLLRDGKHCPGGLPGKVRKAVLRYHQVSSVFVMGLRVSLIATASVAPLSVR